MSEPNWESTELGHRLRVEMTDAMRHEDTLGRLDVDADSGSITMDTTTNTIAQASIVCPDWNQWIENSWIRIVHEIPEYDYRQVMGTFFVYSEGRSFKYGSTAASPSLYSSLKALSMDKVPSPIFVAEGAPISKVFGALLDPFAKYRISPECGEYYYTSTYVIDAGTSKMEAMRSLCANVNWEYRLEGDGTIVFVPFQPYASRPIAYTIDARASRSVVHENTLKPEGSDRMTPGRSIVVWKGDNTDDEPVSAYADVTPDNMASPQRRGYIVAELHELSDLNGDRTSQNALIYARQFLEKDSRVLRKWSMDTLWLPIEIGDCVMFRPEDEDGFTRTIAQNIEYDLSKWKLKITLAEV